MEHDEGDAWAQDELQRQDLAVVIRDDLLSLSRFMINRQRFNSYLSITSPEPASPPSSPLRPFTVIPPAATGLSSSTLRPITAPTKGAFQPKLNLVSRDKALDGTDQQCLTCAKAIVRHVAIYLDSGDIRFEIAERLLLLQEQEDLDDAKLNEYRAALESGADLESSGFAPDVVKSIKEKKKAKTVDHFLRNLQISRTKEEEQKLKKQSLLAFAASLENKSLVGKRGQDEDDDDDDDTAANGPAKTADEIADEINTVFYDKDYYGLFNPGDIKPLFHDPNEPEEPSATQSRFNPFITKLYRLVSKQSEPEEAIVDVLDKVSMLLKIKKCAFPDEIQDAPRKDIFTYIVKEQASDDTRKDIIDLFGKARDDTRPYTAGRTKNMKELYFTDKFVLAAAKGDKRTLLQLLEQGQDVDDFSSTFRYSALHAASDFGNSRCVEILLDHGATVNVRNKITGKTPLHYAAESRRFDVCRQLLSSGASKRTRDMIGLKPLYYATEVQDPDSLEQAKLLRDAPGRIFKVNFVSTVSSGVPNLLSNITMEWSEPKNLGYDKDPIDHHRISWYAMKPRTVNPKYEKFLDLLNLKDKQIEHIPCEHGWVYEDSPERPYTINSLKPAEGYRIIVQAHSAGGYGPPSHKATHMSATDQPSIPGKPMFMTSTSTTVTVSWLPPKWENGEPIKSYQISRQILLKKHMDILFRKKTTKKEHEGNVVVMEGMEDMVKEEDKKEDNESLGGSLDASLEESVESLDDSMWVTYMSTGSKPVFTVRGIPHSGWVQLKVRAKNANGYSQYGKIGGPFQALEPIRLLSHTAHEIDLIWQTIPAKEVICFELNMRKYGLILSEDDYKVVANDIPQNINGIEYSIDGLRPGTDYQFRIRGKIAGEGWQKWEEGIVSNVFRTTDTKPDPPSKPYDKMGASTATSIMLKWEAGASNGKAITEFEVWWEPSKTGWEFLAEVKGPPSLKVSDLEIGGHYLFKVKAKNDIGWGDFSETSNSVTTNPIPIPGVPNMKSRGIGWVELQWEPPGGQMLVDSYEIQKRICVTDSLLHEPWESVTRTCNRNFLLVQELRPCASYQFRVRALTFDGWSSFSPISEAFSTSRRH